MTTDRDLTEEKKAAAASSNDMLKRAGIFAVFGGGVVALVFFGLPSAKPKPVEKKAEVRTTERYEPAYQKPEPVPARTASMVQTAAPMSPPMLQPVAPPDPMLDAARRAPVVAFSKPTVGSVVGGSDVNVGGVGVREADDKGAFERRLVPPKLEGVRAGHLGNRDFIIAMGTSIPCTLETALQSDTPGFTSCVIGRDVLSDNGRVVLLDKGTQVVGEYRGGLSAGQSRLHVVWSRAKTPTGVVIELASAATDDLGRAGFGGYVDSHFMERFGAALLLSVVSDATKIAGQMVQQQTGQSAQGATGAGKDAAAVAVEQTAAIKPTLHKNQGESVSIFVSRDLSFEGVYQLRVTGGRHAGVKAVGNPGRQFGEGMYKSGAVENRSLKDVR